MHIHKQLWVAKGHPTEESEQPLSYLTHVEQNAEGNDLTSFTKRKSTGLWWASGVSCRGDTELPTKHIQTDIFENTPTKGFSIVGSVSRWSTANKLIRIEDSRGFVVEVPTSNLTTLLKYVTVVKGVIQDACVWGKEDNNHLLLPVDSDVYREAIAQTKTHEARVSFNKLKVGQVVKFSGSMNTEYVFCGKGKAKWQVITKQLGEERCNFPRWSVVRPAPDDTVIALRELYDDRFNFVFRKLKGASHLSEVLYKSSGKCILLDKVATTILPLELSISFPYRLCAHQDFDRDKTYQRETTLHIKMKEPQITSEAT